MYFDTTPGLADQGGTVGGELPSTLSRTTMYASLETSSSIIVHRSMKCPWTVSPLPLLIFVWMQALHFCTCFLNVYTLTAVMLCYTHWLFPSAVNDLIWSFYLAQSNTHIHTHTHTHILHCVFETFLNFLIVLLQAIDKKLDQGLGGQKLYHKPPSWVFPLSSSWWLLIQYCSSLVLCRKRKWAWGRG